MGMLNGLSDYHLDPTQSDPGCADPIDPDERGTAACDDGADNDGDGRTDFNVLPLLGDTGCAGPADASE